MSTVGDRFPEYSLKATVGTDLKNAFIAISDKSYEGKCKVYLCWPKDLTFVCPTEISAFAKLNGEFKDRDSQLLGGAARIRNLSTWQGGSTTKI